MKLAEALRQNRRIIVVPKLQLSADALVRLGLLTPLMLIRSTISRQTTAVIQIMRVVVLGVTQRIPTNVGSVATFPIVPHL